MPSELGNFAGVERPMELFVIETPLGDYGWTTRQRHRRATSGQWQQCIWTHAPHAASARWTCRLTANCGSSWSGLLQFDPEVPEPPTPDLQATLEQIELRVPDQAPARLPLQSSGAPYSARLRSGFPLWLW